MARAYDPSLIGVPVLSRRGDGSLVRVDGQHRIACIILAGHGDEPIMMELHDGLSLREEAALFLRLNGGRKAVEAVCRYKARLVAQDPVALDIQAILKGAGCKITASKQRGGVHAVQAIESVYHKGNLAKTLQTLFSWLDGDGEAFEGTFIRAISAFIVAFPEADPEHLAERLQNYAPTKLGSRLKREVQQISGSPAEAARLVLAEIYNRRTPRNKRVGQPDVERMLASA